MLTFMSLSGQGTPVQCKVAKIIKNLPKFPLQETEIVQTHMVTDYVRTSTFQLLHLVFIKYLMKKGTVVTY